LDATSRGRLVEILVRLKEQGVAILLAEHDALPGGAWVDRTLSIADGRVCEGADRVRTGAPTRIPAPGAEAAIASVALEGILPLRRGERVLVTGPNGSGKSTWLARVAREQTPSRGAMRERSGTSWVMQEPRRQLGARSVGAEVAFALRRHGVSRGETRRRTHELLGAFLLAAVADRSPLRLSFGQQHRLAFAAALATRPALLLIDEPFAGLDPGARVQLLAALALEQSATGTAIVVASHDRDPLARWCHRSVGIEDVGASHA
jgi:energy-coupling factor transporter ATP-binding protein EcfA2